METIKITDDFLEMSKIGEELFIEKQNTENTN